MTNYLPVGSRWGQKGGLKEVFRFPEVGGLNCILLIIVLFFNVLFFVLCSYFLCLLFVFSLSFVRVFFWLLFVFSVFYIVVL